VAATALLLQTGTTVLVDVDAFMDAHAGTVSLQDSARSLQLGGAAAGAAVVGCGDVSRMGGAVLGLGGEQTDNLTFVSCTYTGPGRPWPWGTRPPPSPWRGPQP